MINQIYHINNDIKLKGLDDITAVDVEYQALNLIEDALEYNTGFDVDEIVSIYCHGSRIYGQPHSDSDIDVVVFYRGNEHEDSLYNLFNGYLNDGSDNDVETLEINNIKVDFNPICVDDNEKEAEDDINKYIEEHDINYHRLKENKMNYNNMNKKQLCESILKNVSKQLKETLEDYNQEIDVANATNIKDGIVIEITNQYGKALAYDFKKFIPSLKNDSGIYLEQKRNKAIFICADHLLAYQIMNNIFGEKLPDEQTLIRIYKKKASAVNDSVNEKKALTESIDEISGDFLTDFTWNRDDWDSENVTEERAAEQHVKYLKNHGLIVDIKKGRFSTKYYIHYEGQEQLDDLIKWCAWHFGFIETIGSAQIVPKKIKNKIIEYINSGKHGTWI